MSPQTNKAQPSYSHGAQAALLKAVNRVFDLERTAESLDELANGLVLGHILNELDPDFDPSNLETSQSTSKYLTNKRNIQTIYKGLFRFIRRQIPELGCQAKKVDYHAIADNPDAQGISQLLAVMVSAAALGPENKKYVPRIQNNLDRETQSEIMQILRVVQQDIAASEGDEDLDEAIDAVMEARDIDLVVEEQNASLRSQLEIAKKNLSDYITRLEHLQESHDDLRFEKEKNDRELEILRKATQDGANSAEAVKHLEAQVHEQMEVIATYEETIRDHEKAKAQLESEVQRLTQKSLLADEHRDQATEWKHKAEELEKKANTADRYKQKLESQQHLVKEVQNLQYERAELQDQLRSLANDNDRSARTRKAEDELTKMITQSEQHLWDERNQKNQLLRDVATLEDELMRLKAQRTHDETYIQDLQEQIQHGSGEASTQNDALGVEGSTLNLAAELDSASNEGQSIIPLEVSRLKAENDLLRRTMGSTGDAALLRRELEDERNQREHLQQNFNDIFEKHALSQGQIEALMENKIDEETEAFKRLRTLNEELENSLDQSGKRMGVLENTNADQTRELVTLKTQLSAVEKEQTEAIDDLKKTDQLVSESLQGELGRLREKYNFAVSERDAHKSQLIEALLAKDKLRKDSELAKDAEAGPKDSDVVEVSSKEAEKIEKLRERLKERNEQLEKSEQERLDLQRKLKAALGGETAAAQKAETDQVIKNLQRENGLMATAWYDLTTRLQSNHVVLQRRHDAPKSWLSKQRQMVNATPRR